MQDAIVVFWFRRDLRLHDNAGLYHALKAGKPVLPVFILDSEILDDLADKKDKRVDFIMQQLHVMQQTLTTLGSTLHVMHGKPLACFKALITKYAVSDVYTNHDYEPYAQQRDNAVQKMLAENGIGFFTYKDQVIFEQNEVVKDDGTPYTVYTPYSKKWKLKLNEFYLKSYPVNTYYSNFYKTKPLSLPSLTEIGFEATGFRAEAPVLDEAIAAQYGETRDIPSIRGTTRLSLHLRFGTVSIRQLAHQVHGINEKLLNELIWREFYMCILWHYPQVVSTAFKPAYDNIQWSDNKEHFERWCAGKTGIPIVDAGMRELNETGFMHNRVRMIVASFLTKNLLINWRWGEAYFAQKLLDYDLSANNGGWQWAAGSGCDAAPYFRVFNPLLQTQKFDPELKYIRQWVPELNEFHYPKPIVDLTASRDRCLKAYKLALGATKEA